MHMYIYMCIHIFPFIPQATVRTEKKQNNNHSPRSINDCPFFTNVRTGLARLTAKVAHKKNNWEILSDNWNSIINYESNLKFGFNYIFRIYLAPNGNPFVFKLIIKFNRNLFDLTRFRKRFLLVIESMKYSHTKYLYIYVYIPQYRKLSAPYTILHQ